MEFLIERTGLWNNEKPCDDKRLFEKQYDKCEVRTLNSFEAFNLKFGESEGNWKSKGIEHCINSDGFVQRIITTAQKGWFIDLKTLEEIMQFKKTIGFDIIIKNSMWNKQISSIEIHDGWRE